MMLTLAKNPKTLPSTLEKIAASRQRNQDICNAILANPNASKTAIQISRLTE
jgi:hypothetical protein